MKTRLLVSLYAIFLLLVFLIPSYAVSAEPPANFIEASKTLFQQGLADPEGCAYKRIKVRLGTGAEVETNGWVQPDSTTGPRAVCWNGLEYPVTMVGTTANLKADVQSMLDDPSDKSLKIIDWAPKKPGQTKPPSRQLRLGATAFHEVTSVGTDSLLPIRAALLWRAGETGLASKLWDKCVELDDKHNPQTKNPYGLLAADWLWAIFDRAIHETVGKEDQKALADLRQIEKLESAMTAESKKRNWKLEYSSASAVFKDSKPFLKNMEQRAQKAAKSVSKSNNVAEAKVLDSISRFDEINEKQFSDPGAPPVTDSPIARQVIAIGRPAVEPLIDCLEHDERYTRSVGWPRSFFRSRYLVPVRGVAYGCLLQILEKTQFSTTPGALDHHLMRTPDGTTKLVAIIRSCAARDKGLTQAEIWFRDLKDDSKMEEWSRVATMMTSNPAGFFRVGDRSLPSESLRSKTNPSLSELLKKRIDQLNRRNFKEPGYRSDSPVCYADVLAQCLSAWDPVAARPVLAEHWKYAVQDYDSGVWRQAMLKKAANSKWNPNPSELEDYQHRHLELTDLEKLALQRKLVGDPSALRDYADVLLARLKNIQPGKIPFRLLWKYPQDQYMVRIEQAVFEDKTSPSLPLYKAGWDTRGYCNDLVITLPAVQKLVLASLKDKTEIGVASLFPTSPKDVKVRLRGEMLAEPSHNECGFREEKPVDLKGETRVRVCDLFMHYLSRSFLDNEVKMWAPLEKKDAAIAQLTANLKRTFPRLSHNDNQGLLYTRDLHLVIRQ